jgi:hypothetical protein
MVESGGWILGVSDKLSGTKVWENEKLVFHSLNFFSILFFLLTYFFFRELTQPHQVFSLHFSFPICFVISSSFLRATLPTASLSLSWKRVAAEQRDSEVVHSTFSILSTKPIR